MGSFEERLQQFIQMENLTPARLADTMGVQRGGLSHLLAGRNKPSFDFIAKILDLYPDLNCDWLILGKGKPFKSPVETITAPSSFMPELSFEQQNEPLNTENQEFTEEIPSPEPRENPISGKKTIIRLTIFYSDGTYEDR